MVIKSCGNHFSPPTNDQTDGIRLDSERNQQQQQQQQQFIDLLIEK